MEKMYQNHLNVREFKEGTKAQLKLLSSLAKPNDIDEKSVLAAQFWDSLDANSRNALLCPSAVLNWAKNSRNNLYAISNGELWGDYTRPLVDNFWNWLDHGEKSGYPFLHNYRQERIEAARNWFSLVFSFYPPPAFNNPNGVFDLAKWGRFYSDDIPIYVRSKNNLPCTFVDHAGQQRRFANGWVFRKDMYDNAAVFFNQVMWPGLRNPDFETEPRLRFEDLVIMLFAHLSKGKNVFYRIVCEKKVLPPYIFAAFQQAERIHAGSPTEEYFPELPETRSTEDMPPLYHRVETWRQQFEGFGDLPSKIVWDFNHMPEKEKKRWQRFSDESSCPAEFLYEIVIFETRESRWKSPLMTKLIEKGDAKDFSLARTRLANAGLIKQQKPRKKP